MEIQILKDLKSKKIKLNSSNNIFVFTDIGFTKRDYERFELKYLNKFCNIYIIDLTLLKSKLFYNFKKKNFYKTQNYYLCKNIKDTEKKILKISSAFKYNYCIDYSSNNYKFKKLKKKLQLQGIKFIFYDTGLFTKPELNFSQKFLRILGFIRLNKFKILKKKIFNYFKIQDKKSVNKFIYDILISTGLSSKVEAKKKIYSYSLDYNLFLNNLDNLNKFKKYLVFIDQNYPNHPGQKYRKKSKNIDETNYYFELKKILLFLKEKLKLEILIAAHPTSEIKFLENKLNFKVIKNDTLNLIKNSSLVVTITSTALSLALLYKKPLIFLTNNDIQNCSDAYLPNTLAKYTGSICINMSKEKYFDLKKVDFMNIDKKKFKNYIFNYVKHPKSNNIKPTKKLIKYILNEKNNID